MLAIPSELGIALAALATAGGPGDRVSMRIDPTWRDVGGPALVVHLTPEPGWHLYWSNPGDSGQPPRVQVTLPPTWTQGEPRFPTPTILSEGGSTTFGYAGPCTLIVPIIPNRMGIEALPEPPALVTVEVTWLVCREQCEKGSARATVAMNLTQGSELEPLPRAVSEQFPIPMPDGATVEIRGDRAGDASFEGTLDLFIPGVLAGSHLLLDVPAAVELAASAKAPLAVESSPGGTSAGARAAPTYSVPVTIRPADVETESLRIMGVVLRPSASAILVDFSVPREALRNNPSIGAPTPTRLRPPAPDHITSKETLQ